VARGNTMKDNGLAQIMGGMFLVVPLMCSLAILVVLTIKLCQWILQ